MKKPQGIILYEGPSQIDGKNIVVITTGWVNCENEKTGRMIQIWVMRSDISPLEAHKIGEDYSVCGNCKHRKWGTCYVALYHAPYQIYNTYKRGKYEYFSPINAHWFKGHNIRICSYGDPVAVPVLIWHGLINMADNHTGYTHQWKTCSKEYKKFFMASVDNEKEKEQAIKMGWRTFRVRLEGDKLYQDEYICPASLEGGKKMNCNTCLSCCGKTRNGKNPTIIFHGGQRGKKKRRFVKIIEMIRKKKKYTHLIPEYLKVKT